jgi:hypothetical protein
MVRAPAPSEVLAMRLRYVLLASCFAIGCGSNNPSGDDASTPDSAGNAPDALPTGYTELIGRDWTIAPGEYYKCVRIAVPHDMWINSIHAVEPQGTHHEVLTISTSSSPLGDYDCNAGNLDLNMLFASGVGTDDLTFPDGVAMHLQAGQFINLNIHLFNTLPSGNLTGHSSIAVKEIPAASVQNEAEMVFGGNARFTIPGDTGTTPYDVNGGCTFQHDETIVAYWPHMHMYATHQKVTATIGGVPTVVHDADYSFYDQKNYPLATPIVMHAGDSIATDCYYENHTGNPVSFGESSTDEMCFTGIYRYPKTATYLFECTNPPPF